MGLFMCSVTREVLVLSASLSQHYALDTTVQRSITEESFTTDLIYYYVTQKKTGGISNAPKARKIGWLITLLHAPWK